MLTRSEMLALPAGSRLPAAVAEALPAQTPAPPWRCRVEALLWWHRAVEPALAAAGPIASGRRVSYVTVGAFVRYLSSPVGPYSEVFAAPVWVAGRYGLASVTVPFIAVDSVPSIHGGRAHWALPKVLASFDWPGDDGAGSGDDGAGSGDDGAGSGEGGVGSGSGSALGVSAVGDGWSVGGQFVGRGPALPVVGFLPCAQSFPDGSVRTSMVKQRGMARLGRLAVSVQGADLSPWLLPGRHRCLRITRATMVVGPPR